MAAGETGSGRESFFAALQRAGMPPPEEFSVAPLHQLVPRATLAKISEFIRVFDEVTTREAWRRAALREAPQIAQMARPEVCFFSAWDFHLPPEGGFELIEFNDNGSGFLFSAIVNAAYYEAAGLMRDRRIETPASLSAFETRVLEMVEREAVGFFGERPTDLFLVLDDAQALREGKFRQELRLLCDLFRRRGLRAEVGCPTQTHWDGRRLLLAGERIGFVVNRATDFFWRSEEFSALRAAYAAGGVYVAPNPYTFATRSDKRLMEWLSQPLWDAELGIGPDERRILSAHVPQTHVVRAENADMLARAKSEFVFKPSRGFAGRGLLDSDMVGATRLRRLARRQEAYVAQKKIAKPTVAREGTTLWTDLRVWAYRGEIFLLSGRGSRRQDRIDLTPPGGWLPTYASS
jgi:hypothetical protein